MAIVAYKKDVCIGCGRCALHCPIDVIRIDEETKRPVILYPQDCMMCEMCLMQCPVDAIVFTPQKDVDVLLSWG